MRSEHLRGLVWLLTIGAVIELVVLRTATRTLINIPGTERFDTPISVVAEIGRLAYYVAAVSLVAVMVMLAVGALRSRSPRRITQGAAVLAFLVVAGAGRREAVPWTAVGWSGMAIMILVTVLGLRGARSVPVGLFMVASVAAGWSVVAQAGADGLTGSRVDILVWVAEASLVLAGLTAPLLLDRPPGTAGLIFGALTAVFVAGSLAGGASTISILVLWNVGVPGWMPGLAYALAAGALATTLWSAAARGEWPVFVGAMLLAAGGVGMISTYQTGLVIVGILVLGETGEQRSMGVEAVTSKPADVAVPLGVS